MLVSDFIENRTKNLSDSFYDCLPSVCPECGSNTEMSEALTGLHCTNPRCPDKIVQRLLAMANQLGVKELGEARAYAFVKKFNIKNPLDIFSYEPDIDGQIADNVNLEISNRIASAFRERNTFTLAEYIKIANLPFIQSSANIIFDGYDDLELAYASIEKGGIPYIQTKLNIKDGSLSVRALKIHDTLVEFKQDLINGLKGVVITEIYNNKDMHFYKAVCSTAVGEPFRTKADFYAYCNNNFPNKHIDFGNAVTKTTEYVVWSGADGTPADVTNKVKKARSYNEKGLDIKIVTAKQFINILKGDIV